MSELRFPFPANVIAGKGKITARDVALLKAEAFAEGIQDAEGAVLLFALNGACRDTCPEWAQFFTETISTFIIDRCHPQGTLDDANALWLERMLAADGIVASPLEFELLHQILKRAPHVPDSLRVFALSQIRHAIHSGTGAYAALRPAPQKGISETDMAFARLVIDAGGGEGIASPAEYRVLLSIDAIAHPGLNENGWVRFLFMVRPQPEARTDRKRAGRAAA